MGSAAPALSAAALPLACLAEDASAREFAAALPLHVRILDAGLLLDEPVLLLASADVFQRRRPMPEFRDCSWVVLSERELPSGPPLVASLPPSAPVEVCARLLQAIAREQHARRQLLELQNQLKVAQSDIGALNRIGQALSAEHDTTRLMEMIVRESRRMTDSDAGSLYLVTESPGRGPAQLEFKVAQNHSLPVPFHESRMPVDRTSIAGYVAITGESLRIHDAYQLPSQVSYTFNTAFDSQSGYLTRSILAVPMINAQGRAVGVLQLINRKRGRDAVLRSAADVDTYVIRYSRRDVELISSLASQAAVAVENSTLYEEIHQLFEGFVRASVLAIETRDPATSGHSFRVADLTLSLADVVDRCNRGPYASLHFRPEQIRELRYAALLHDFGKVGVREQVLVKAKKLYPEQLERVRHRCAALRSLVREQDAQRRLQYLLANGQERFRQRLNEFDQQLRDRLQEIDEALQTILACNEPTVLPEHDFLRLHQLATMEFRRDGEPITLLEPEELQLLTIPQGSLNEDERRQIEAHVVHSFNFLRQIPWTREMRDVPHIARAHHEKLDGSGYPEGITGEHIPVQTRMMTIVDIFDALAAADRPYKRAVPVEEALNILEMEARAGMLDQDLLDLFIEAKIHEELKRLRERK